MSIKELFIFKPGSFIIATILQILGASLEVAVAYVLTLQFNAIRGRNLQLFLAFALAQFVLYLLVYLSYNLAGILWQKLLQKYFHQVRQELIAHFYADGQHHEVSEVQNRLTNDLRLLHQDYFNSFRYIVGMLVAVVSVAATLFTFQWSLLVTCLLLAFVQIYLPKLLEQSLQKAVNSVSKRNKEYLKTLTAWLVGLTEVQRYLACDKLFKTVAENSGRLEAANIQKEKVDQKLDYLNQLAYSVGDSLLFLLTGFLVVNHLAAFGLLASIGNFNTALFASLQGIANYRGRMRSTKALQAQLFKDRQPISVESDQQVAVSAAFELQNLAIKFKNGVNVTYPNFKIKAGEKILLTGDSGAGKSTLFKLILGAIKPSSGRIEFENDAGTKIQPDLSKIGYIPQEPNLFPGTIKENITMFDPKLDEKVPEVATEVSFKEDLAKFKAGLDQKLDLDKLNISGGQRQKIVLARAKIHQSEIILIDEGTSAIDQQATMAILQKLVKTRATIVFIAHNFNQEMRQLFDREIHLQKQ